MSTPTPSTDQVSLLLGPDSTLTLLRSGEGPPALLLHGGAGPDSLDGLVQHFAGSRDVLVPTHPGWDGTPRPAWLAGVDTLATVYLDLLEHLGLHDVLLLGSSFGGWVAAEMAVRDRDSRIDRLVLMGAIGAQIPGLDPQRPGPPGPPAAITAPSAAPDQQPAGTTPPPGPSRASLQALAAYGGSALSDPSLLSRLAGVRARTLVVWGSDDPVVSPAYGRAYAAAFPDAHFALIEGGGHLPFRAARGSTLAAIEEFLTRSPSLVATLD